MKWTLIFSLFGLGLFGQANVSYLYLMKDDQAPERRFQLGEEIAVKDSTEPEWFRGQITAIQSDRLQVDHKVFFLENVEGLRVYRPLMRIFGLAMLNGAALFTGVAMFNRATNGNDPILREGQLYFGGGLAAAGGLLTWLSRKTFRMEEGWYIKIIDLSEEAWQKQQQ